MYHINEIHNKNLAAMLDIGNSNSFLARVRIIVPMSYMVLLCPY